jgi:hypothetical protein
LEFCRSPDGTQIIQTLPPVKNFLARHEFSRIIRRNRKKLLRTTVEELSAAALSTPCSAKRRGFGRIQFEQTLIRVLNPSEEK